MYGNLRNLRGARGTRVVATVKDYPGGWNSRAPYAKNWLRQHILL
jgi:hypothetical protein